MMMAIRFVLVLAVSIALRAGAAEAHVSAVGPIGITVSDLDRAVTFYSEVLGFEKGRQIEVAGPEYERLEGVFGMRARVATLTLGSETIELTEYLAPRGRAMPADSHANDRWFQHIAIVTSDLDRAYTLLRERHVEHASTGPQRLPDWNPAAGGIRAFYFRDPDGHFLELIQFPSGKGDPRWQSKDRLLLGIDHTAIVVADTDSSLRFYRDLLGMHIAGTSENWGTEQEHLNNVFGARLRITSLRATRGPGIELLEYETPRTGRPRPSDARANDLLHWQTDLVATGSVKKLAGRLSDARATFASSGPTQLPDESFGFREGVLVADPDGHALRIRDNGE